MISPAPLGARAFRPVRAINAAVFDSIAVGLARRLTRGPIKKPEALVEAHRKLAAEPRYVEATSRATSDEASVSDRLKLSTGAFAAVP